jgi:hypothetical protein
MLVVELELSDGTELEVAIEEPDPDDETGLPKDEFEADEVVAAIGADTLLVGVLVGRGTAIVTDCDWSWPFALPGDGV